MTQTYKKKLIEVAIPLERSHTNGEGLVQSGMGRQGLVGLILVDGQHASVELDEVDVVLEQRVQLGVARRSLLRGPSFAWRGLLGLLGCRQDLLQAQG